ncbi:MAG: hypothetical protein J2P49_03960 [Methylocapsa sp.]|nr:hypothetical protein [Methylocapsa sp.]
MRASEKPEGGGCSSPAAERAEYRQFTGESGGDGLVAGPQQIHVAGQGPEGGNFFFVACDLAAMEARHKLRGLATNL